MEIDPRDLSGVDVQRDVTDGMFAQGRMFPTSPDVDGDVKPLSALDRVRRGDFRRMFDSLYSGVNCSSCPAHIGCVPPPATNTPKTSPTAAAVQVRDRG